VEEGFAILKGKFFRYSDFSCGALLGRFTREGIEGISTQVFPSAWNTHPSTTSLSTNR